MNQAHLLNTVWMWKCRRETRAFLRATRNVAATQQRVLHNILAANRDTDFGRQHCFDRIHDAHSYQRQVPDGHYEDFQPAIDRIAAGQGNVLTRDPVCLLEPTSGTTSGEKLVPYTSGLRTQFQRGIAAWIGDLFQHLPQVRRGRAYWSISPAFGPRRRSPGGIAIGFDDDTAYLSRPERWLVERLLAVPAGVAQAPDVESFRYQTLLHLLAAEDLALISVWSPTFLTALLAQVQPWQARLCRDIRRGTQTNTNSKTNTLAANPRRAEQLQKTFEDDLPWADKLQSVWPRLALVSCWADAAAALALPEARRLLPAVQFQPKGLLATEAFVSLPLVRQPGAALAVRSHFFEFEQLDAAATTEVGTHRYRLADELDDGGRYRVLVTTAGGLYRYHLRDEVTVVGHLNECPLLRFDGRSDQGCDLVGEKLSEPHVQRVLHDLCQQYHLSPRFAMLVPVAGQPPRYRLYVQLPAAADPRTDADRPTRFPEREHQRERNQRSGIRQNSDGDPATCSPDPTNHQDRKSLEKTLATSLQHGLNTNPHYRLAVELRQLAPAEVHFLSDSGPSVWTVYERQRMAQGQKPGDIKPAVLDAWTGWPEMFESAPRATCGTRGVRA